MHATRTRCLIHAGNAALALLASALLTQTLTAQVVAPGTGGTAAPHASTPATWDSSPRWVIPQIGRAVGVAAIAVTDVAAQVSIRGNAATTTLDIGVSNRGARPEQAVLLVPVPDGATVTGFSFQGPASEPTAKFLPRDEARRIYDGIVARERDPALLEWAGWNLVRSSVFPVAAGGIQRVRIEWETLLTGDGARLDYVLPRSDLSGGPPWRVDVRVEGPDIAGAYSPSHELSTWRADTGLVGKASPSGPGSFRLSVVRGTSPTATVLTYPDPANGGGYFLLLAAAPAEQRNAELKREVTLVLDRSGSLAGAAFERAKIAALQILDGLSERDTANVIDFSNGVSRFAPAPVAMTPKTRQDLRAYVSALRPNGGTNIHDALLEALRQPMPAPDTLAEVLFITDGVPTIGRVKENDIATLVEKGNAAGRRVFTVGLGNDVNVPLLDRVADRSHAVAEYFPMDQDMTARLVKLGEQLRGPVLMDATLAFATVDGAAAPGRTEEVLPDRLPDLFRGGTLVVLGRYRGEEPFRVNVHGKTSAGPADVQVTVDPRQASAANAFVPRLWASRRIAVLVDQIRQQDQEMPGTMTPNDPRWRELVGEIVRLSTTFGILTEYTSMLALEGSNLNNMHALAEACSSALQGRAMQGRVGAGAVNQGVNWNRQKLEAAQSSTTMYVAPDGNRVYAGNMNQCADKTMYRVRNEWVDGSLAGVATPAVQEEVAYGSERHRQILWELVGEGRQSALALEGDIVIKHRGRVILVHNGQNPC